MTESSNLSRSLQTVKGSSYARLTPSQSRSYSAFSLHFFIHLRRLVGGLRMRHLVGCVVVVPLALLLSGCLTETVIDAKGAGTMMIKIRLTSEAQLAANRKRLESSSIKVSSATVDKDKWATYQLQFEDITKLNTVSMFQNSTVTLVDADAGNKTLTVKNVNKNPNKMPEEMVNYFGKEAKFSITVPGDVVKTNATSTAGKTAIWTYALNDFTNAPDITLEVTFKADKGDTTDKTDKPAAAATPS